MKILSKWLRYYLPEHSRRRPSTRRRPDIAWHCRRRHLRSSAPNGHIFEMDITTNRVDAMNHYGIAREAATIYNLPLATARHRAARRSAAAKPFSVQIAPEAPNLCGRFTARVLRNITIAPSTGIRRRALRAARNRSPSPTRLMPPTTSCKASASPPTPSTWTRLTAELSSASRARARSCDFSTESSARSTPKISSSPTTPRRWGWPESWAAGIR